MKDVGFTPNREVGVTKGISGRQAPRSEYGWRVPCVKWIMLASPFHGGRRLLRVLRSDPYLLELWGDPKAYGIAGLVVAIITATPTGIIIRKEAPLIRRLFHRRTSAGGGAITLILIGVFERFWVVIALIVVWGLLLRQAADAGPAGLSERSDSVTAARDYSLLRLDARLDRRRRRPTGARALGGKPSASWLYLLAGRSRRWLCRSSCSRVARTHRLTPPAAMPMRRSSRRSRRSRARADRYRTPARARLA